MAVHVWLAAQLAGIGKIQGTIVITDRIQVRETWIRDERRSAGLCVYLPEAVMVCAIQRKKKTTTDCQPAAVGEVAVGRRIYVGEGTVEVAAVSPAIIHHVYNAGTSRGRQV